MWSRADVLFCRPTSVSLGVKRRAAEWRTLGLEAQHAIAVFHGGAGGDSYREHGEIVAEVGGFSKRDAREALRKD
jgi:hypothetical protein